MSISIYYSDSDDADDLEAYEKKFANKWNADGYTAFKIPPTNFDVQLAYKSKIRAEERLDSFSCGMWSPDVVDVEGEHATRVQNDRIISAVKHCFALTKREESHILDRQPGRTTIIRHLSGSLFSAGPKIGIENLIDNNKYSIDFEKVMRDVLMQKVESVNFKSLLCACEDAPLEERHCLAKYLLFAMSVCKKKRIVDTIYKLLVSFLESWPLLIGDFLDIFLNWGIPKKLIQRPCAFGKDTCSIKVAPEYRLRLSRYNVFKVLDYICDMYEGKVHSHIESTLTFVKVILLLWLDNKVSKSFHSVKFQSSVTRLLEGFDTVQSPENVVLEFLDLSFENNHNQAWIVVQLMESNSLSTNLVGRLVATQYLLREFHIIPSHHPEALDLRALHILLVNEVETFLAKELYSVHLVVMVVEAYVMFYGIKHEDRDVLDTLVEWTASVTTYFSDDANCGMLDRQILVTQLKTFHMKLKSKIQLYLTIEERQAIYLTLNSNYFTLEDMKHYYGEYEPEPIAEEDPDDYLDDLDDVCSEVSMYISTQEILSLLIMEESESESD